MKRAPEGSGQAMRVSSHRGGMIVMASSPRIKFGAGYMAKKINYKHMKRAMRKISHKGE